MAELPKAQTQDRVRSLIPMPAAPGLPRPMEEDLPAAATVDLPSAADSLAKFKELGAKAKGVGRRPIDASKVAAALQGLQVPSYPTHRGAKEIYSRSIQIPAEICEAIESLTDGPKDVPGFVRDAVRQIAESRIPPRKIINQAGEVAQARRVPGRGKIQVTVAMDKMVFGTLDVLSQRTKLSHKAVLEACTVLYLQALMSAEG